MSLKYFTFFALLTLVSACTQDHPYLYDRPGFDAGDAPKGVVRNPDPLVKAAPNYYQEQQGHQPQYYQQPPQQYYQQPVPAYAVPNGYYQQREAAGSRYYSNPYSIPPAGNYYQPRYDVDQYYKPPTYYGGEAPATEIKKRPEMNGTY